eukprot:2842815-Amphidinium_carterae.1
MMVVSSTDASVSKSPRLIRVQRVSRLYKLIRLPRLAKLIELRNMDTPTMGLIRSKRGVRVANFITALCW